MTDWQLRGLVFAGAMVVVRLIQGALINVWQTQSALISIVLLILFLIGVVVWGVRDGAEDAKASPDPDRRQDLAMTWLVAGVVAGLISGVVAWLISLKDKALYVGGPINELSTFAAFTALLVFLPAIAGVAAGRWKVDRNPPPIHHHGTGENRADTDVFAAVRPDTPIETYGATQGEEQAGAVATAEREEQTEPMAHGESPTEEIRISDYSQSPATTAEESTQELPAEND